MRGETIILLVSFIVISSFFISYMPNEIYESGLTSSYNIGNEFDAWKITAQGGITLEHTLIKGGWVTYHIEETNLTSDFVVYWNWLFSNRIRIKRFILASSGEQNMNPYITKNMLIANWNPVFNSSTVRVSDNMGMLEGIFEDTNITRNDISLAWDDGEMNCTILLANAEPLRERIGAKELVYALLNFKVSNIYATIHPLLALMVSVIFYVPIILVFFAVTMWALHGSN